MTWKHPHRLNGWKKEENAIPLVEISKRNLEIDVTSAVVSLFDV